eukprot:scaffold23201_cov108-Isochrysis_galbana.AAC.2
MAAGALRGLAPRDDAGRETPERKGLRKRKSRRVRLRVCVVSSALRKFRVGWLTARAGRPGDGCLAGPGIEPPSAAVRVGGERCSGATDWWARATCHVRNEKTTQGFLADGLTDYSETLCLRQQVAGRQAPQHRAQRPQQQQPQQQQQPTAAARPQAASRRCADSGEQTTGTANHPATQSKLKVNE